MAIREAPTDAGPADCVLFVDGAGVGIIEAKRDGATLTSVESQTRKYQTAYPDALADLLEPSGASPPDS